MYLHLGLNFVLAHLACISASWACTTECHKKTSACTYHILQTGQNGHTLQTGFPVEDQHVHNHPCLSDPVRKEIQREFWTNANLDGERGTVFILYPTGIIPLGMHYLGLSRESFFAAGRDARGEWGSILTKLGWAGSRSDPLRTSPETVCHCKWHTVSVLLPQVYFVIYAVDYY